MGSILLIVSILVLAVATPAQAGYKVTDVTLPNIATLGLTGASSGFEVGNGIVGYVRCGRGTCAIIHAYLWAGTSANAVDLTPTGYTGAHVSAIQNGVEVG